MRVVMCDTVTRRRAALKSGTALFRSNFSRRWGCVKKKISAPLPFFSGLYVSRVTKKSPRQDRSRLAKKKSGVLEQISHATARAKAGAWWPCWPSMIGHESRHPAAKPRLREWCAACLRVRRREIRVSLAGFHTGRDRAARQEPLVRVRASLNPYRSATRRRGLTQGRGSAPGRTRAVSACSTRATRPCPQPAACPNAPAHSRASSIAPPAIGTERDA